MQKFDFFTRMATVNAAGPNMDGRPKDAPTLVFICGSCDEAHDDEDEAAACCRPSVRERYRCGVCKAIHQEEDEASACCPAIASGQPLQCPICLQRADSFQVAADCCLHTHPTMTALGRERVAEAVGRGTPWADAIQANAFH